MFLGPIVAVIVFNASVLLVALRAVLASRAARARESSATRRAIGWLRGAAMLLCLLGLTWSIAFLSILSVGQPTTAIAFTILNSLQVGSRHVGDFLAARNRRNYFYWRRSLKTILLSYLHFVGRIYFRQPRSSQRKSVCCTSTQLGRLQQAQAWRLVGLGDAIQWRESKCARRLVNDTNCRCNKRQNAASPPLPQGERLQAAAMVAASNSWRQWRW